MRRVQITCIVGSSFFLGAIFDLLLNNYGWYSIFMIPVYVLALNYFVNEIIELVN